MGQENQEGNEKNKIVADLFRLKSKFFLANRRFLDLSWLLFMPTHLSCAAQCQKLAKTGDACSKSCELASYDHTSPEIPQGWLAAPFEGDHNLVSPNDKSGITWGHLFGRNLNPIIRLPGWVEPTPTIVANPSLGTLCSVCGCPQVQSPGGPTCKFGHGGAEGVKSSIPISSIPEGAAAAQFIPALRPRINVRAKGQRGEREVVKIIQDVVDRVRAAHKSEPIVIQRNALQAHLGGCDIHGLDGFAIEVKMQEVENIPGWWKQTVSQAAKLSIPNKVPHVPILFYRRNGRPWSVKWRAYVQTPRDRDLIELDVEAELSDFVEWFEAAYDEAMTEWAQTLG